MEPKNENIEFYIDFLSQDDNDNDTNKNIGDTNSVTDTNLTENSIDNIQNLLNETNDDYKMVDFLNYMTNYTVKELMVICEFYNIAKELKMIKANKEAIVHAIQIYEGNSDNYENVARRHNFWFYMRELKNDKFMKKYLLW